MWAIVSFFNPMIALLLICIIPLAEVGEHRIVTCFLGQTTGGSWLAYLISIDAVLVLCGAVLTSFVGVWFIESYDIRQNITKLLLKQNKRGSNYRIIISFLILCVSVLFVTEGTLLL
jgi:amino acid transporter